MNLLQQILSPENFIHAYEVLLNKQLGTRKYKNATGIDAISLEDIAHKADSFLQQAYTELKNNQPLSPVLEHEILKPNGDTRIIYSYATIDKLKAQAIWNILEPLFESAYSPYLFSYRGQPFVQPKAVKSAVKRYKKNYTRDFVVRADVVNYTESIQKERLRTILEAIIPCSETLSRLDLFLQVSVIATNGAFVTRTGIVQGVPLMAGFANIYMTDIDQLLGNKLAFYRRVGDDFLLLDPRKEVLYKSFTRLQEMLSERGLSFSPDKLNLGRAHEVPFTYLGVAFKQGQCSIANRGVTSFLSVIERVFPASPGNANDRANAVESRVLQSNIRQMMIDFLASYRYSFSSHQIKMMSQKVFQILTKHLFGSVTPRLLQRTKSMTSDFMPSLWHFYSLTTHMHVPFCRMV